MRSQTFPSSKRPLVFLLRLIPSAPQAPHCLNQNLIGVPGRGLDHRHHFINKGVGHTFLEQVAHGVDEIEGGFAAAQWLRTTSFY